jgi:hypothetical protein
MPYSSENYLDIFDKSYEDNHEEQFENLRNNKIFTYRVKTIKSGKMLESEIYPIWKNKNEVSKAKKVMETRKAQKNLNDKNAKKYFIRLVNTNFTEEDLVIDLTYSGRIPNEEQALKDVENYRRRLKNYIRKNNLPDLKYICVVEFDTEGKGKKRIHHHMIMNSMDRDVAEKLWGKGYANCRRLQPNEFGLEGLARYMTKDPKGSKRWCASRNLKKPSVTIADHKISKRQAEKIAKCQVDAAALFQKMYKGYMFNDLQVRRSDFVSGAYLYARMRVNEAVENNKRKKQERKPSKGAEEKYET